MIIHQHKDGSVGHQYEIGDRVIVQRTIPGGWFDMGPTHSEFCTVKRIWDAKHFPQRESLSGTSWHTAEIEVHYSDEWGWAHCFPWMLSPHPDTLASARIVSAGG
jgi:hypothetical protein